MIRLGIFIGLAVGLATVAHGEEVQVAVAANFVAPLQQISAGFKERSGHQIAIISGATGKFYAQIKAGAPFEILLAADVATAAKLVAEGDAVANTSFTYAIGKLVLWSARENFVADGVDLLKRATFDHIAVANPKLAPYGAAAEQTLKTLGDYEALAAKIVHGENIAQTYQFVATGNAELGLVALSQVIDENGKLKSGSMWIVPQKFYTPLRQNAVLLNKGAERAAAKDFMAYLQSEPARRIIERYGYGLPP